VVQGADWPIAIIATHDVACGARLWRAGGKRRLTVVVKASFAMVPGSAMQLVAPLDVVVGDRHTDDIADRSLVTAGELAPYLPRAEVSFVGHAYAPKPIPEMSVRLAVVGNRQLVDKTLYVYGERMWLDDGQVTQPVPFTRIPLRYERASRGLAGYEENPTGMTYAAGQPVPNIVDPSDPEAPAGFGPIPSSWPSRRRLLRGLDPSFVEGAEPELPDAFAWSYFHAAPTDQRCSFFEGREWVVLDGLNAEHPHLESHLPGARAQARLYDTEATGHTELTLNADTMWIDGDRGIVSVVWRGNREVGSDAELARSQIFAGLELPGRPIPWPGERARRASSIPARAMPEHTPVPASPAPHSPHPSAPRPPSGPELHGYVSPPHTSASSMPPGPVAYGHPNGYVQPSTYGPANPGSSPPPATVGMPTARLGHEHLHTHGGGQRVEASGSGSAWPAVAPRPGSEAPAAAATYVAPQAPVANPPLPLSPQLTPRPIDVAGTLAPAPVRRAGAARASGRRGTGSQSPGQHPGLVQPGRRGARGEGPRDGRVRERREALEHPGELLVLRIHRAHGPGERHGDPGQSRAIADDRLGRTQPGRPPRIHTRLRRLPRSRPATTRAAGVLQHASGEGPQRQHDLRARQRDRQAAARGCPGTFPR
jgi:hypothetical protein